MARWHGTLAWQNMGYGVNGDPLRDGKLDLPELLEEPAPGEWGGAPQFIARRKWREAVTYREKAPHEYVARKWETDVIRRFGYADFYYRVRHIYWAIDEFKYWTMGWPLDETKVINRARVDAPEPWKEV